MRGHLARPTWVGLFALLAAPSLLSAGALSVSPVRVMLSAKQPVASIVVKNDGTEPSVVQLDLDNWAQTGATEGDDSYALTSDLLATPPIFTIQPGATRTIRIGLRRSPDTQHELTYRLYLQEVAPPLDPDYRGLRMTLRIGVPVFVAATVKTRPELRWHAAATSDGRIRLQLANTGSEHVKVTDLSVDPADSKIGSVMRPVSTYVLPGHSREWLMKIDGKVVPGAKIKIKARTDSIGDLDANLTLDPS